MIKQFYFKQFSLALSTQYKCQTVLSGTTTPSQSGLGSNGNKGALCIPQNSSITAATPSDCLVSYSGHSLEESYPSTEMQLVFTAGPAN